MAEVNELEEGTVARIDFGKVAQIGRDGHQVVPVVLQDADSEDVLFIGYANEEALRLTFERRSAVLYSTSRNEIWHKGATSGLVQKVRELLIDDDQDCIWLRVDVSGGASCHVGYRSCFYRRVPVGDAGDSAGSGGKPLELEFTESEKVFDPAAVYGDAPNPTRL